MLTSLFSNSLRGLFRASIPSMVPMQAFASAARPSFKARPSPRKRSKSPNQPASDPNAYVDPKIENLTKYVEELSAETAKKVFKNCDYEKDMVPALNLYQKLEFNNKQLKFLFKRKPSLLRLARPEDKNDIVQFTEFFEKKWNLNKHQIRSAVLRDPWLLNKTNEEIVAKGEDLRAKLKFTDKELRRLLIIYPKVFELKNEEVDRIIQIVSDYTDLPERTLGIIAARFPYFLCLNPERLLSSLKVLHARKFTNEQIIRIMKRHPEVFTIDKHSLDISFNLLMKSLLSSVDAAKIMTENPRLMTIDPYKIMSQKRRMIKNCGVNWPTFRKMVREHPRIFVKSVGSTSLKIRYLTQRMKIRPKMEPAFPIILNYSYANIIRPRGELMMKKDAILPWTQVLNLTDKEFVEKVDSNLDELNKIKSEYTEINNELDYKTRFFSRYFSNRGSRAKY